MDKHKYKVSKYQQAIYDWVKQGTGNAVIQAVAGSGKTSTIVEATNLIPSNKRCVFVAFNKAIADELKTKVPRHVEAKTLHSLGLSFFRGNGLSPEIDTNKVTQLIESEIEDIETNQRGDYYTFLKRIIPLIKNTLIDYTNLEQLEDIKERFNITDEINDRMMLAIRHIIEKNNANTSKIDFDDMIYLPVILNLANGNYDWVLVDESQDLNRTQFELIKRICTKSTRVIAVGDKRQCQPAGTKILLSKGMIKNIEDIKVGDEVVSASHWNGWHFVGIENQGQKILDIGKRKYTGKMYNILCDEKKSKSTSNHKWIVKVDANKDKNKYVTYLMRKGKHYRIGQCQLSYDKGVRSFGIWQRCKDEQADAIWILNVYDNMQDSKIQEQVLGYKYGIPTIRFVPSNANKWQKNNYNDVYQYIDNFESKAEQILNDFNRDIEYPLWKKGKRTIINWLGAKQIFEVETCNLLPCCMRISSYKNSVNMNWKDFQIEIDNVKDIDVYSLKVSKHEVYVADGLLTHNSIYAFRGADTDSMNNFRDEFNAVELPLSICYRCPKSHIALAKEIVPEIEASDFAEEGIVESVNLLDAVELANDKDLILCRTNAPLIKVAFTLIRNGKKAIIRGRDIGANLIKMIEKYKANDLGDLYMKLEAFKKLNDDKLALIEKGKYDNKKKNSIMTNIDCVETIFAVMEDCDTIDEVKRKIESIFSDDKEGIICSSVHRAKGLQSETVFIINRDKMPHPMAKTDEEIEQEFNILYVALTRSKHSLYFIREKI